MGLIQSGTRLVVILVECLDGAAVDQNGLESVDIGSQGKCIVQPGIDAQVPAVIRFVGNFFICPVDHFNNESAMLGDDPHLLDGGCILMLEFDTEVVQHGDLDISALVQFCSLIVDENRGPSAFLVISGQFRPSSEFVRGFPISVSCLFPGGHVLSDKTKDLLDKMDAVHGRVDHAVFLVSRLLEALIQLGIGHP